MFCLDTSDHMRNGDYSPSRILSVQGAANLLLNSKISSNPENHVGFLTMGGTSCTMMETLTGNVDRVMGTMTKLPIGGRLHFANALQIATLALSYRINQRAEKRIIAFVGSPILEDAKTLEKLAKKLRKDDVAVDVIALGSEGNEEVLRTFVDAVNKQDNSRLLIVPPGANVEDTVITSAINLGNEAAERAAANATQAGGAGGGFGGGGGFEYGVDPNLDPELAMVLRMSAEEERQRLAALAGGNNNTAQAIDASPGPSASPIAPANNVPSSSTPQTQIGTDQSDRVLTEEEELELAIKMSMQEAENDNANAAPNPQQATGVDPDFDAALEDPDFQKRLEEELNQQNNGSNGKDSKKDDKK